MSAHAAGEDRVGLYLSIDVSAFAAEVAALVVERLAPQLSKPGQSPWLDVSSAAEYLCCSSERIRKLVARRAIPFHQEREGGRIFFHRRELDEWLTAQ